MRLVLLLSLLTAPLTAHATNGNPCMDFTDRVNVQFLSSSVATSTAAIQIIPQTSGGQTTRICSLYLNSVSGTAPTFSLVFGTGVNCGTSQGTLIASWPTVGTQSYSMDFLNAITPANQAVCVKAGGTSPVSDFYMSFIQI